MAMNRERKKASHQILFQYNEGLLSQKEAINAKGHYSAETDRAGHPDRGMPRGHCIVVNVRSRVAPGKTLIGIPLWEKSKAGGSVRVARTDEDEGNSTIARWEGAPTECLLREREDDQA